MKIEEDIYKEIFSCSLFEFSHVNIYLNIYFVNYYDDYDKGLFLIVQITKGIIGPYLLTFMYLMGC